MSTEPRAVEFERRAEKDLERLDPQVKQRVLSAIGGSQMIREAPTCEG
ncbi:MAG: type II toxin-antitoxin system RelE family toxin [Trebonia sp.]